MALIKPFRGYFVNHDRISKVVAPAYDALTPEQRHEFAGRNPHNYVNVMRSMDEFPETERPTLDEVLEMNANHLKLMLDADDFDPVEQPCLYVYRLAVDGHEQTAIVAEVPITDGHEKAILKHEKTRSDKEDQLTRYHDVVGATSSPVCLAYKSATRIDEIVESITRTTPVCSFSAHDDVVQTVWRIVDAPTISELIEVFKAVNAMYLTDGHHRFASGLRYAQKQRANNDHHDGNEDYNFMLVALFPDDQLRILPYNRCVKDLNGLGVAEFLRALSDAFTVEKLNPGESANPTKRHQLGMLLDHEWYLLTLKNQQISEADPVDSLDVSILQNMILHPILGIEDARMNERLDYCAGNTGIEGLERRCRAGWRVCFAFHPTSIEELMQVADQGTVMPPKSTYFDPKVRSGLFLLLR